MAADLMQLAVPGSGSGSDGLSGRPSVRSPPAPTSSGALHPAGSPSPATSRSGTAGSRRSQAGAAAPRGKQPAADPSSSAPSSGAPSSDASRANPSDPGRSAASGNSSSNSALGGQTARSVTKGRGTSDTSAAGAAQAATQGVATQVAAAATDFSAALALSLAATPTGSAPTDTSAGKASADCAADGAGEPPGKHSVADPVSSALTLLEQALAGALAAVASAPTGASASAAAASASGAAMGASATNSGAGTAASRSSAAALNALLAQNLGSDPKAGTSGPNAGGSNTGPAASIPTLAGNAATPAAPAAAANTAAAALAAAAQLSSASHLGTQQVTTDSSRMTLASRVGTSAWTDELGTKLTWMAHQGIQSASLQLSPEHLGPLQVTISVHDGHASVWFGAAQPDTRTALQQSLPQLRQLFAGQGLTLADAGVSRESPRDQGRQSSTRPAAPVSGVAGVSRESVGTHSSTTGGLGLLDTYV